MHRDKYRALTTKHVSYIKELAGRRITKKEF